MGITRSAGERGMKRSIAVAALILGSGFSVSFSGQTSAESKGAAQRGWDSMLRPLNSPVASLTAYDSLWKQWGLTERPADLAKAARERYGLHPAPFDNKGLPLGFHHAPG